MSDVDSVPQPGPGPEPGTWTMRLPTDEAEHWLAVNEELRARMAAPVVLVDDDFASFRRPVWVVNDEAAARVREQLAVSIEQMREGLPQLAHAAQGALRPFRELHDALVEAGLAEDEAPTEPRARALWLRQHRNTGPHRAGPQDARRTR